MTEAPTTDSPDLTDYLQKDKIELAELLTKLSKGTIRQTRDWLDSKLDTSFKEQNNPSLVEQLYANTRIRLNQSEDRLVHSLSVLLSKKSETRDQSSPDYYMGNHKKGITSIQGLDTSVSSMCELTLETARLVIKPHELYTTYSGSLDYSGEQSRFILTSLIELSKRTFNFSLRSTSDAHSKYKVIRTLLPLWQLVMLNHDLSEIESQSLVKNPANEGKNCYFLFKFSPIFTNNIRERYVEIPEDMHLRIVAAAKSKRIPECTHVMRDFLLREKQQKRYTLIRDEETLVELFNLRKPWHEGRKKEVRTNLAKAFAIYQTLGLLKNVTHTHGKKGQQQYTIEINPEFK